MKISSSTILLLTSRICYRTSDIWHGTLASHIGMWHLISEIWHLTSDLWHITYNIWHLTYDVWRMAYDIWHMTYDTDGLCNSQLNWPKGWLSEKVLCVTSFSWYLELEMQVKQLWTVALQVRVSQVDSVVVISFLKSIHMGIKEPAWSLQAMYEHSKHLKLHNFLKKSVVWFQ